MFGQVFKIYTTMLGIKNVPYYICGMVIKKIQGIISHIKNGMTKFSKRGQMAKEMVSADINPIRYWSFIRPVKAKTRLKVAITSQLLALLGDGLYIHDKKNGVVKPFKLSSLMVIAKKRLGEIPPSASKHYQSLESYKRKTLNYMVLSSKGVMTPKTGMRASTMFEILELCNCSLLVLPLKKGEDV